MKEYKIEYVERIKSGGANKVINQESKNGWHPVQISYSTGFGGHGLVILFERTKCDTE